MSSSWLVIEQDVGGDEGIVKVVPSPDAAQAYVTERIERGVAPERFRVFNADEIAFSVAYQPVVTIGSDAPYQAKPEAFAQDGVRFSEMFKTESGEPAESVR